MMQPTHERALDRSLSRLADPVIPPALVARMIVEIPQMAQLQPEGRALVLDPRRSPESVIAGLADNAVGDGFGRRVGWASLVAGLAACFIAVLFLPRSEVEHSAAPSAQVPRDRAAPSRSAPEIALAPDIPKAPEDSPPRSKSRAGGRHLAKPAASSPVDLAAPAPQFAAAQAQPAAPIEISAPNDRIAIAPVAGPPAPRGGDDEIGADDGTAIPAPSAMGPRAPTGMGFGSMGTEGGEGQSYPRGRR